MITTHELHYRIRMMLDMTVMTAMWRVEHSENKESFKILLPAFFCIDVGRGCQQTDCHQLKP